MSSAMDGFMIRFHRRDGKPREDYLFIERNETDAA